MATGSFDDVAKVAHAAMGRFQARESNLIEAILKIRNNRRYVDLSDDDKKKVDELNSELETCQIAEARLGRVTAALLDDTNEVKLLIDNLTKVTGNLKASVERLTKLKEAVNEVGDLLQTVSGLIQKLEGLVQPAAKAGATPPKSTGT